jgi:hypothetical protein
LRGFALESHIHHRWGVRCNPTRGFGRRQCKILVVTGTTRISFFLGGSVLLRCVCNQRAAKEKSEQSISCPLCPAPRASNSSRISLRPVFDRHTAGQLQLRAVARHRRRTARATAAGSRSVTVPIHLEGELYEDPNIVLQGGHVDMHGAPHTGMTISAACSGMGGERSLHMDRR